VRNPQRSASPSISIAGVLQQDEYGSVFVFDEVIKESSKLGRGAGAADIPRSIGYVDFFSRPPPGVNEKRIDSSYRALNEPACENHGVIRHPPH
jgi:hypothetical protein